MSKIVCAGLSFSWPDGTPVLTDLSFSVAAGRTGLVAPNGAGKSTLLRLVAGELTPDAGAVTVEGLLGYLPQTLPLTAPLTGAEVLEVAPVVAALAAIEAGDASEENFAAVGNDWDVEERARVQLDRLGLGEVTLDRPLGTLSGGQVVSLGLAAQLLKQPDVLLLDEPTNNLDRAARHRLYDVLGAWAGCLLLVSHDRVLLDRMDRIAELGPSAITFFGGNFAAYEEAKRPAPTPTSRGSCGACCSGVRRSPPAARTTRTRNGSRARGRGWPRRTARCVRTTRWRCHCPTPRSRPAAWCSTVSGSACGTSSTT